MKTVSVIFSTHNDAKNGFLKKSLTSLCDESSCEIIVVNKSDEIPELLNTLPVKLISSKDPSRAVRQNLGIKAAQGDIILLHHPRSVLERGAIQELTEAMENQMITWGCFTHGFNIKHPLLQFTSWYSNKVRCDQKSIAYLDHCVFFRRSLLENDPTPVPEVDIFEDTELSLKLKKLGKPVRLSKQSTTSAIRFQKNGVYRQSLLNQVLKVGYGLGVSDGWMNRLYEKGLSLNSKY